MAGRGDAGQRPDALLRRDAVAGEGAGTHAAAHHAAAPHHHGHAAAVERHVELERVGKIELCRQRIGRQRLGLAKRLVAQRRACVINQAADFQFAAAQIVDHDRRAARRA